MTETRDPLPEEQGAENRIRVEQNHMDLESNCSTKAREVQALASLGWQLLPLCWPSSPGQCGCGKHHEGRDIGKAPLTDHGCKGASIETVVLEGWQRLYPRANYGIASGSKSGIVVVDIDPRHGGDESWARLIEQHGPPPETVEAITGSGGRHLYYRHPGIEIGNSAGKLGQGLDIRADGGYVVAPGSLHSSGLRYDWRPGHAPWEIELAPMPRWMQETAVQSGERRNGFVLPEEIREGCRNDSLFRFACALRRMGMNEVEILDHLKLVNQRARPGLPDEELEQIVQSGMRYDPAKEYSRSDLGNAKRMIDIFGPTVRYCEPWKKWLVYDGQSWAIDQGLKVHAMAKETVGLMWHEVRTIQEPGKREAFIRFLLRSESAKGIRDMIELARSEPGVPILPEALDRDPWLLNTTNGTIDLRTGELLKHDPANMITKIVPVEYDPRAECPLWLSFLDRIMAKDESRISFLQRASGYSATGITRDRSAFIPWGDGANGKSTFLMIVGEALGDYAMKTPTESFLLQRDGAIPNDIARLKGARFVWASETEEGKKLAEAKLKDLTGNEPIVARFMRAEWFSFTPEFKPWMGTNHKPEIKGKDAAIWDRIKLIPFIVRIPEAERDLDLPEKLKTELPGILRWIVEGCLAWQAEGLNVPEEVKQATEEYRSEMDPYTQFIIECLAFEPEGFCSNPDLRFQYGRWAYQAGESVPHDEAETTKDIGNALKRRGCISHTQRENKSVQRGWKGVTFKANWSMEPVVTKAPGIKDVDSNMPF